ncbi:MAG: hypothetical protein QOK15_1071, partial [Nocardioidaceae bacterium]|nr:hypothetical protein [Nocardioidaceae bacterium]
MTSPAVTFLGLPTAAPSSHLHGDETFPQAAA